MKRYILSCLILSLLIQFNGCVTDHYITIQELKTYDGNNAVSIMTKKRHKYILLKPEDDGKLKIDVKNGKEECLYCTNWEIHDDSIGLNCIREDQLEEGSYNIADLTGYTVQSYEIGAIVVTKFDLLGTSLLLSGPVMLMYVIPRLILGWQR